MQINRILSSIAFVYCIAISPISSAAPVAGEIDYVVVAWQHESISIGEDEDVLSLSVEVGINEQGLPIELEYRLRNVSSDTFVGYFPSMSYGIGNFLLIMKDGNIYKDAQTASDFETSYSLYTLDPDEEISWSVDMAELISTSSEFYESERQGFARISTILPLLYAPVGTDVASYSSFTREVARVVCSGPRL